MDFFETIQKRQSVRKFSPHPVEEEKLRRILEAANRAPSAGNLQAYEIFVVTSPEIKKKLSVAVGNQPCVTEAPVVLVFCAHPKLSAVRYGSRGEQLYCIQDATIACSYAQLGCTALGLASVWIGALMEPEMIRDLFPLEQEQWPVVMLPVGYAAEKPEPMPRRPLSDLVRRVNS